MVTRPKNISIWIRINDCALERFTVCALPYQMQKMRKMLLKQLKQQMKSCSVSTLTSVIIKPV